MSFLSRIFQAKPDTSIENLKAAIAKNLEERAKDRRFAKKALDLEAALQKASEEFHKNPTDENLTTFLQTRRTVAADAPVLREISANLAKNRQQEDLEKIREACGPALEAVKARLEGEISDIAKKDVAEAQKYGMAPEMSPARQRLMLMLDTAKIMQEQHLPNLNMGNVLAADSNLRNITSFILGDNREYHPRPAGQMRVIKAVD